MQIKMIRRESLKLVEKLLGEMFYVVVNHAIPLFFFVLHLFCSGVFTFQSEQFQPHAGRKAAIS